MNFTESFDQFSSRLTSMDLALYAGVGLVLWVLFKDKLSPVQKTLMGLMDNAKSAISQAPSVIVSTPVVVDNVVDSTDDVFFSLVASWKQTRDLAVKSGCSEAVKVADQMFPFLSPNVCGSSTEKDVVK
jgi:hypothetical protein